MKSAACSYLSLLTFCQLRPWIPFYVTPFVYSYNQPTEHLHEPVLVVRVDSGKKCAQYVQMVPSSPHGVHLLTAKDDHLEARRSVTCSDRLFLVGPVSPLPILVNHVTFNSRPFFACLFFSFSLSESDTIRANLQNDGSIVVFFRKCFHAVFPVAAKFSKCHRE